MANIPVVSLDESDDELCFISSCPVHKNAHKNVPEMQSFNDSKIHSYLSPIFNCERFFPNPPASLKVSHVEPKREVWASIEPSNEIFETSFPPSNVNLPNINSEKTHYGPNFFFDFAKAITRSFPYERFARAQGCEISDIKDIMVDTLINPLMKQRAVNDLRGKTSDRGNDKNNYPIEPGVIVSAAPLGYDLVPKDEAPEVGALANRIRHARQSAKMNQLKYEDDVSCFDSSASMERAQSDVTSEDIKARQDDGQFHLETDEDNISEPQADSTNESTPPNYRKRVYEEKVLYEARVLGRRLNEGIYQRSHHSNPPKKLKMTWPTRTSTSAAHPTHPSSIARTSGRRPVCRDFAGSYWNLNPEQGPAITGYGGTFGHLVELNQINIIKRRWDRRNFGDIPVPQQDITGFDDDTDEEVGGESGNEADDSENGTYYDFADPDIAEKFFDISYWR
ncbi:hypothetical protein LOZ64_001404 [Ophidiomyces ophidiicola]|nr:hypothetical protein LOZ64_001404 [Ophidiomyces ophidiicola]